MNGKWAESETRTIDLTEDDPEIFALYLNPVYNNHLPTMAQDLEHMRSLDRTAFITAFVKESNTIFRLYVLAEKLQDPSAQDAALAAILDLSDLKQGTPTHLRIVLHDVLLLTCGAICQGIGCANCMV
jgi:hypothetical protein